MARVTRGVSVLVMAVLAAALLWIPATAAPGPLANNLGLKTIPFRIVNNTGLGGNLWVLIQGQVRQPDVDPKFWEWYYVSNANGDVTKFPYIGPPGQGVGLNLGAGAVFNINLPQLAAARIFFSFTNPIYVQTSGAGKAPSAPCGWCAADPNFKTVFDWAEFTWLPEAAPFTTSLGMNATQVDMWGLAMLLALTGTSDAGTVGTVRKAGFADTGARGKVMTDLVSAGQPWSKLIMMSGKRKLRVIAPYHGIEVGVFPQDQLAAYIDSVWTYYQTHELIGHSEYRNYTGMVDPGSGLLFFKQDGGANPDPRFSIKKPTTQKAYENSLPVQECDNMDTGPCNRARAVAAHLAAAFMRTTLLVNSDLKESNCNVDQFYKQPPVNQYAKAFHKYALKHLAYSFGFDDTCQQSSFVQLHDPTKLVITLQPFN